MIHPSLSHLFEDWQLHIDAVDDGAIATAVFGDGNVEISVTGAGDDADEALANVFGTINEAAGALSCL